jgi:tetratricopeptide (TPR) repeat protein/TolB-like protein
MFCSSCGAPLAPGSTVCARCSRAPLPPVITAATDDETILGHRSSTSLSASASRYDETIGAPSVSVTGAVGPLRPGTAFGSRYHLTRLLGMGGMGAVYQAWDEELGVSVALKVIRPEITADPAAARDIERRFKRELLLARQVTHKNVVRIHDLGEIDGIKYLTMPYIQGSDLASVLRKEGKLPVSRALTIARQVASGLQAAHEAGVVHRDLKPANIMIDGEDQAVIMDFGISRSVSGAGATVAGAVVGTLEYMAPEQALAQPIDHRVDIYALGLVIRDMLAGARNAGGAETAVAELMSRMQMPLPSVRAADGTIPEAVDVLIARCTAPDPGARYQTTQELVLELEALDPAGRRGTGPLTPIPLGRLTLPSSPSPVGGIGTSKRHWMRWAAAALVLLVVAVAGVWLTRDRDAAADVTGAPAGKPASLALVPLRNGTGDPSLDWLGSSLADMLAAEIGQAEQLRVVAPDRLYQLLRDLRIGSTTELDPASVRRIAEFGSADTVAAGRFEKLGDQIRINVTLHSAARELAIVRATAAGESDLLRAAKELSDGIRASLVPSASARKEVESHAFKPSTTSVPALRFYSEGLQLARQGEHLDAIKRFEQATGADPQFALAFSKLAVSLAAVGRSEEAERVSRQALGLSQQLPDQERERISGTHARLTNDTDKAIEVYERLSESRPDDLQLQFDLAGLYETKGALDKALHAYTRVADADPKHGEALYAAGRVAIQRGEYQRSLDSLNSALSIAIQLDKPESRARILQALGIAYRNLGKHDDALAHYQQSLAVKKQIGDRRGIASSLSEIAYIHDLQGRPEEAVASYKEALEIRRALGDKRGVGITLSNLGASYLDRGRYPDALAALREALQIHRETGDETWQARCLSNIGNLYIATAQYEEARTNLERALELREKANVAGPTALTLTSLGDVSTRLGDYDRAQRQYLRAIDLWRNAGDKRGTAIGSFGMGSLLLQQTRYAAGFDAIAEALVTLREQKEQSVLLGEVLSGHGAAASLLGRAAEADRSLAEALALARELKNDSLAAQTVNNQGDAAYYRGDTGTARVLYEQADGLASRAANRYQALRAGISLARLSAEEGRAAAVPALRARIRDADALGLKPLAAEGSLYLGITLLRSRNVRAARSELESALSRNERLGARALVAQAHHFLAEAARASGDGKSADTHAAQARRILDELQKESGADIAKRHDLMALRQ